MQLETSTGCAGPPIITIVRALHSFWAAVPDLQFFSSLRVALVSAQTMTGLPQPKALRCLIEEASVSALVFSFPWRLGLRKLHPGSQALHRVLKQHSCWPLSCALNPVAQPTAHLPSRCLTRKPGSPQRAFICLNCLSLFVKPWYPQDLPWHHLGQWSERGVRAPTWSSKLSKWAPVATRVLSFFFGES